MFMVFLAGFVATLSGYARQADVLSIIPDIATQLLELESGQLQMIMHGLSVQDEAIFEHNPKFQTVAAGGILILVTILLMMNAVAIVIRSRFRRYH